MSVVDLGVGNDELADSEDCASEASSSSGSGGVSLVLHATAAHTYRFDDDATAASDDEEYSANVSKWKGV
jgi:hypothetical protein